MTEHDAKKLCLAKIEQWKKRLLDLTKRNRLLYFQERRTAAFRITSPNLETLIEKLVVEGKSLKFPVPKAGDQLELASISTQTDADQETRERDVRPGDLETDVLVRDLQSRLYRLRRDWHTWREEQGINTLFLAAGFLRWKESDSQEETILSPILLVPVGLQKERLDKPYIIEPLDEDPVINPALAFKLETDFRTSLPSMPEELDPQSVSAYLTEVRNLVKAKGWTVLEHVWLGRFTYEKFVMSQDLAEHMGAACQHPVIVALAKGGALPKPSDPAELKDLDTLLDPTEVFPILDADSSQLDALVRARHSQNLVMQGPPGTGKSQTIANLIVQALRDGKRVLFVSEKMAALEVVHRRLKEVGLDFACLEVHSHRSNKAKIIQELRKALDYPYAQKTHSYSAEQFDRLKRRRSRLNDYVRELHALRGKLKVSAYQVHGRLAKLIHAPETTVELPFEEPLEVTTLQLEEWTEALGALGQIPEVADKPSAHPWYRAEFDPKKFSERDQKRLLDANKSLEEHLEHLSSTASRLAEQIGIATPHTIDEATRLLKLYILLKNTPKLSTFCLHAQKKDLPSISNFTEEAERRATHLRDRLSDFDQLFEASLLTETVEEIAKRFSKKYRSPARWLYLSLWRDLRTIHRHWKGSEWFSYQKAVRGISLAQAIRDERRWFEKREGKFSEILGDLFAGEDTDWAARHEGFRWIGEIFGLLDGSTLPKKLRDLIASQETVSSIAGSAIRELEPLMHRALSALEIVTPVFPHKKLEEERLANLLTWLKPMKELADLKDWAEYLRAKGVCTRLKLGSLLTSLEGMRIPSKTYRDAFMKCFWTVWLISVRETTPALGEFRSRSHQEILEEFRALDRELKSVTASLIQDATENRQPKGASGISDEGQVGILRREIQKKKRLKPLRRLFSEIPHLLQDLKPCLLMSPLSVASYLGTSPFSFDLVIFDEASQIPPADAIGAILRGKQVIVAGDDKQLPPTRFFQADVDTDEEVEEGSPEEPLESILDECATILGFVRTQLLWHYRSKHEELIAFSNSRFYDGRLITFPSPSVTGSSGAVKFLYLQNGVYDRGKSRTNRREAELVANIVEEHFLKHGHSASLGVITLNLAQEEAIWMEWERRKTQKPQLHAFDDPNVDEPFFVKALEKVQGDERDYIVISVGYGPDQTGAITMNFGPINQSGGERRLNVAITRARQQTTVVCSLLPSQLDLARLTRGHSGVEALQQYLEYARNGGKFKLEGEDTGRQTESDFEDAVKQELVARGLKVDSQVGCSGFRLDLAVRHPKRETEYVLGIECDGATYHSFRTARDRDRLRQELLESLGWNIFRIWSTDWFKGPKAHERIVDEIAQRVKEFAARGTQTVPRRELRPSHKKGGNPKNALSGADDANEPSTNSMPMPDSREMIKKLPIYREYEFSRFFSRDSFYASEWDDQARAAIVKTIQAIAEKEAPIHINLIAQRVAAGYRISRVGENVEKIVRSAIRVAIADKRITFKHDFVWYAAYDPDRLTPRRSPVNGTPRPAELVALEELAAAVIWILTRDRGVRRESLVTNVARVMGYDRTGHKVEDRIDKAIALLLDKGKVSEYGDQIVLVA